MAVFALLFIVMPLVEIYVAAQIGHAVGVLNTVGLLLLLSLSGVWLTKFAGFGVIARMRRQLAAGRMPTDELIDGGLVLAAGVLLVVPGFVTGALGLLLLFPPTRGLGRATVKRRFQGRVTYLRGSTDGRPLEGPDIIDI